MIHEERTRMMTKLAMYENKHGKKELQITRYAPGDYVAAQMLKSFLCGTVAFVIMAGLYALYNVEELMLDLFSMDILRFVIRIVLVYIIFIGLYLGICYAHISYWYSVYKKHVNRFLMGMKELYRHYVQSGN